MQIRDEKIWIRVRDGKNSDPGKTARNRNTDFNTDPDMQRCVHGLYLVALVDLHTHIYALTLSQ